MLRNRQVLTRQRFIDAEPMFPGGLPLPDTPEEAKRQYDSGHTFDQEYADDDGLVRATLIEEDLDRLAELVTDVKRRADQAIAHLDRNYDRDTDRALTYSDVRDAIASVVALAGKWIYLLRGELPGNWRPQFATDWQEPLRAPVFRPST